MPEPLFSSIGVLPSIAQDFLWADYVELLCLCSMNGCVSSGNVQAFAQEAQDIQADADGDSEDSGEEPSRSEPEELDDKISKRWADIRRRLVARSKAWENWPFILDGNVLTSRFEAKNPEHRLYAALLIASSLRLCNDKRSGEVTGAFEEISYHWLRHSLNDHWEVRVFGAHQTLPASYSGTLYEKFHALAQDIRVKLTKDADDYDPRNTGDGGIDLVAWMRLGDQRTQLPVIFGQCACSPTDWEIKQYTVTPSAVGSHLNMQPDGAPYCFVPHDLLANDSRWQRSSNVGGAVLIDRARILHLFRAANALKDVPALPFVDEAVTMGAELAT